MNNAPLSMTVFAVSPEERPIFEALALEHNLVLTMTEEKPGLQNVHLVQNRAAVNVLSDVVITPELWDAWKQAGVRMAVTRTIGVEHMNRDYAASIGIPVKNITYSPASVADYAIMMMLMVLRNIKPMLQRYEAGDFTATGIRGRELPNLTVGILGAGRIGITTAKHLSGFGCRIRYWDRREKPELSGVAEYVSLETLLSQSDIVSLHLAAVAETEHFMDRNRIFSMKPGSVLINTARGPLVENGALIEALESGHLAGAGLDVFDGDRSIYYRDFKNRPVPSRDMALLRALPQVLMLPHMAYCTDQALRDMVEHSVYACLAMWENA